VKKGILAKDVKPGMMSLMSSTSGAMKGYFVVSVIIDMNIVTLSYVIVDDFSSLHISPRFMTTTYFASEQFFGYENEVVL
jgi:hypothetical protein